MVLLLTASLLISFAFFWLLHFTVDRILDEYIEKTDFNQKQSVEYVGSLQRFVEDEEIGFDNLELIEDWLKANPAVVLQIYDEDYLVFDSVNGMIAAPVYERRDDEAAVWENFFVLTLTDRDAYICLYGNFDYALYQTTRFLEVALSLLLFFVCFFFGIRTKTKYIIRLQEEIDLLEGGSLDYPITVSGKDELADLAAGLDSMRISFRHQIEEAERISQTNQTMITQISHDLRTPLTAVTLYAEILQNHPELPESQKQEYLDTILKKVSHMKDLSDHLLDYSTEVQTSKTAAVEWLSPAEAFFEELSDLCAFLEQQGFQTETGLLWDAPKLCVNVEYLSRIFNNISSNIIKYADKDSPVTIRSAQENGMYCLTFINQKSPLPPDEGGKGIGIHSIEAMLKELGGSAEVLSGDDLFKLSLNFRLS